MPSSTDRLVAERYALSALLGRGAMGAVWLAEDSLLKRQVAVKEIDIPPGFDAEERQALESRLLREARAAARLSHPGIVSVYDVVEDSDRPWIVMEYVDAPTLDERIKQEGRLSVTEASRIGIELLDVLEVAHSEGIVHRDVKPANVMCPSDGHVKLADFGIASVQDDPKITQTGLVLGSPSFMAPEQASQGTSGPPGDLWSLGATLYQAVEGRPPFDKGGPLPTLTAVMTEDPRPMTHGPDLRVVIDALLQKDPARRPSIPRARQMLQDLHKPATSATTVAETPAAATAVEDRARPAASPRRRTPVATRRPARTGGNPWPWVALVVALVALIAVPLMMREPDDRTDSGGGRERDRQEGSAGGQDTGGKEAPAEPAEGWTTYTDPGSGYTLQYPEGWSIVTRAENTLDFTDPDTGAYLRVAWTDAPGDDVMARLGEIAESFDASHSNYQEIQMTPTEYQGHEAGLWEYTYEDGGASLHAYNLQFVVDETYGFALNFQTPEDEWAASQDLWESLQASFEPPA